MTAKFPTLVAPGGSYTKALVASAYGAEEVYVWVPFTSLRMRQNKLYSFDELQRTVEQLHAYGSQAFLTMNIFPRNTDIHIFESVVERISELQPDAIIFSDPGTFHTIRKYLPSTPLHLSTQTTTLNYAAVKFWADLGVKRIVLARELYIDEIVEMKKQVPEIELEAFVHGAMCMSYSGRCLLGDYLWWRAGNRWECNHACRFKYRVFLEEERRSWKLMEVTSDEDGEHILSSRDLCTIRKLDQVLPVVDAMKIEGRSKSEFYVGAIVKAYKHVRDSLLAGKQPDERIMNLVHMVPHREYWEGFLFNSLKDFPDGESVPQTTRELGTAGPLFARNFYGVFEQETIEKWGKLYRSLAPKETLVRGMKLKYLTPEAMGELVIEDILDEKGKEKEKADCNCGKVFIQTSLSDLQAWTLLYVEPKM